jgi:hypothetical protein
VGHGPADGESYTVEFTCKQQYRIWADDGTDRGNDTEDLPKRIVCPLRRFVSFEENPIDSAIFTEKIY